MVGSVEVAEGGARLSAMFCAELLELAEGRGCGGCESHGVQFRSWQDLEDCDPSTTNRRASGSKDCMQHKRGNDGYVRCRYLRMTGGLEQNVEVTGRYLEDHDGRAHSGGARVYSSYRAA